jgi:hypothetical protein
VGSFAFCKAHFVRNKILMRGKGYQGLAIVQIVKLIKPEVETGVAMNNSEQVVQFLCKEN